MSMTLYDVPLAFNRLGEAIFLKLPLYQTRTTYSPIYINTELFQQFWPSESCDWETMSRVIRDMFSVSLVQQTPECAQAGWAYVDRQADPYPFAMAGNLGSGRAYYAGQCFNLKGEKTPLAISERARFSDGVVEMERAIWEACCANSLAHDLVSPTSPVLAVLDTHELCEVSWREHPVKRALLVRIDQEGSLDRLSHLFYNQSPQSRGDLLNIAAALGRLEGEKYCERIEHGAWSAGNHSSQGHLIDYDTVSLVKGRHPQHSSSPWHIENYFGFEHYGQKKLLEALCADPHINKECVPLPLLTEALEYSRQHTIAHRLPYLMGFEDSDALFTREPDLCHALAEAWVKITPYFYANYQSFYCKDGVSSLPHLYDTACFMRLYASCFENDFSAEDWLALMKENTLLVQPLKPTPTPLFETDEAQTYGQQILDHCDPFLVRTAEQYAALDQHALTFIAQYAAVFQHLLAISQSSPSQVAGRAYVINEDRLYLFPAFTVSYILATHPHAAPHALHRHIQTVIEASQRKPQTSLKSDIRVFFEGYSYTSIIGREFHHCLLLYKDKFNFTPPYSLRWIVDGIEQLFSINETADAVTLMGPAFPLSEMATPGFREKTLMFSEILIMINQENFLLNDLLAT